MQADYFSGGRFFGSGAYPPAMPAGRPPKKEQSPIGKRISQAREAAGLSQAELGARLGVSQQVVAAWERKLTGVHSTNLARLCEELGVSSDQLLGLERAPRPTGHTTEQRLRKAFARLEGLPPKDRKQVVDLIHSLAEKERLREERASA